MTSAAAESPFVKGAAAMAAAASNTQKKVKPEMDPLRGMTFPQIHFHGRRYWRRDLVSHI